MEEARPKDNTDVNIMNFISVACYYGFVKDDASDSLMADTTVSDTAQWLRCCATKRKVAGSFPDGVIGIFH